VTTRKTAAVDSGASTLWASIGTRSQFLPDILNSLFSQGRISRSEPGTQQRKGSGFLHGNRISPVRLLSSFRGASKTRTRKFEIPGSMLRIAPE